MANFYYCTLKVNGAKIYSTQMILVKVLTIDFQIHFTYFK